MLLKLIIIILVVASLTIITWRLASQRRSLPCPTWLAWMVEMDNPFTKVSRAATIAQSVKLEPGMSVIDIGCGPGRVTIPIAKKVGPQGIVVAVDMQDGMLERVKKKATAARLENIALLKAEIGKGKLENNAFDRALLVSVLGEVPHQKEAMQEIFDTLKPGGILSVTEVIFDPHFQRRSTVQKLAETVGFEQGDFYGSWYAYTLNLKKPIPGTKQNR